MKIPPDLLDTLRDAIAPLDTPALRHAYLTGQFSNADRCKDVNLRYRWDLFFASKEAMQAVYTETQFGRSGFTDAHIDTALRKLVPPLKGTP